MASRLFDQPKEPDHPRFRAWDSYLKEPGVERVSVQVRRKREGLVTLPPKVFVSFCRADTSVVKQDEADWEPELEVWLTDRHAVQAVDTDNEVLRFSLLLKDALRPIADRFGDGYFNATLIQFAREEFGKIKEVAAVLRQIHEPDAASLSSSDCADRILAEFQKLVARLMHLYPPGKTPNALFGSEAVARSILGAALALHLADRYHLTERKMLGFG